MAGQTLNVGVVGYGMSARLLHIPFIKTTAGLALYAIVQRSPQDTNSAPKDHPSLRHYNDVDALFADENVHVVVITSTPDTHFEFARRALEGGKHVCVEKPFVQRADQADELVQLARRQGKLVCVFQNRRWDMDFLMARRLIAEGVLGNVWEFNTHYDRFKTVVRAGWKASLPVSQAGSVLYDLGTHLIDQVYILYGKPKSVRGRLLTQASSSSSHDAEFPDAVSAELVYEHPLLVNVRISQRSVQENQPRFWIRGTKGSFRCTGVDSQEDQLKAGMTPLDPGFGALDHKRFSLDLLDEQDVPVSAPLPHIEPPTYRAFYAGFAESLLNNKAEDVPVKAEEAAQVLRIIEAIIESAKTGQEVLL